MSAASVREIELKLTLPRSVLARLRRHPLLAAAERVLPSRTLVNTYVDTPDLELRARRTAVRIRKQGRQWLQTVKCAPDAVGGLSSRPEWEYPYLAAGFDFSPVTDEAVRSHLQVLQPRLEPVFTTTFRREVWRVQPQDGWEFLVMLDVGEVVAAGRHEPICELELELVCGPVAQLFDFAMALAQDIPLWPENVSKAQRGYALYRQERWLPDRQGDSILVPGMSPLSAFRAQALATLANWQRNAHGALHDDDPEFIHQLRVALRRLRALCKLFAPVLPPNFARYWADSLGRFARSLGEVRELDVMIDTYIAPVSQADVPHHDFQHLLAAAHDERERARAAARQSILSPAHGHLQLALMAALHALPDESPADSPRIRAFARQRLDRLQRRVLRRARKSADLAPEGLHALRLAVKQLRYASEVFAPLLTGKAWRRFGRRVVRLQEELGFLHDVTVVRDRLARWAIHQPAQQAAAGSFVAGWHAPRFTRLRANILKRVDELARLGRPWQA